MGYYNCMNYKEKMNIIFKNKGLSLFCNSYHNFQYVVISDTVKDRPSLGQ